MVQAGERIVSTDAERYLLIYMIAVVVIVTALVIIFFIVFQKRKNKILIDKFKQQQAFEEEIAKTQLEIQEQTLKNVGQELHDNVGQLLSFASMQLNVASDLAAEKLKGKIDDTKDVIKNTIQEVRALSKSLNSDVISNFGLLESLQNEVDRLNKLKKIRAELSLSGDTYTLNSKKDELILFRIVQEFLSNTMKYAEATELKIVLNYKVDALHIHVKDDGKGFNEALIAKGSGLLNMKNRAELIHANYKLESHPGQGVTLDLSYPIS
ncbi:MAG: sensor histidine kinase [Bacteroidia bacterium]|nr:sensor histidine kinase [Bacteroidia bacterium]NND51411.1 sensor histidine kinase [Flavobacteriaceae bacterium]